MSSKPDEIHRQRMMLGPVAPITLWMYPALRRVEGDRQRTVLAEAKRLAHRRWLSFFFWLVILAAAALHVWAYVTDRAELRIGATIALLLVLVVIQLHDYLRTRAILHSRR